MSTDPKNDSRPDPRMEHSRRASFGWMIQRLARHTDRAMTERLSPLGLSLSQFAVLMMVLEKGGQTQTQIGQNFGMPAYAISRALDHLETTGLLERRAHPTSRRTYTIHGTAKGQALLPQLFAIIQATNAELTAPLEDTEKAQLAGLLSVAVPGDRVAPARLHPQLTR